jgi:L-2,4-diaminobutyric acid acetyltransferase
MTQIMSQTITLRQPTALDGKAVYELVARCSPLDTNSMYCNLLQCSHFSSTSVAAVIKGKEDIKDDKNELQGFISAYILPERPDTVFVWQVAVGEAARGQGLARRMLEEIISRPVCSEVRFLETTITKSNQASWALFESFAKHQQTDLQRSMMFDQKTHFGMAHDSELLVRIGPFSNTD